MAEQLLPDGPPGAGRPTGGVGHRLGVAGAFRAGQDGLFVTGPGRYHDTTQRPLGAVPGWLLTLVATVRVRDLEPGRPSRRTHDIVLTVEIAGEDLDAAVQVAIGDARSRLADQGHEVVGVHCRDHHRTNVVKPTEVLPVANDYL